MGVSVVPLSDQLAAYFGVKEGVLVSEVASGTPAATAGIQAGDVITAVNGRNVLSVRRCWFAKHGKPSRGRRSMFG